jgi:hypothetical protein
MNWSGRLSSFALIVGVMVAAMTMAWDVTRFEELRAGWPAPSATVDSPADFQQRMVRLRSFEDQPVIAQTARDFALTAALRADPLTPAVVEDAVDDVLAAAPALTRAWLLLAAVRLDQGQPPEAVLAAFRMSVLTGSHEGEVMAKRAVFGLSNWEIFPEDDRRALVRDVLAAMQDRDWSARLREVIAAKPDETREEFRQLLTGLGGFSETGVDGLSRIGL